MRNLRQQRLRRLQNADLGLRNVKTERVLILYLARANRLDKMLVWLLHLGQAVTRVVFGRRKGSTVPEAAG